MKVEKTFCDICKAQEKKNHWTDAFGRAHLSLKDIPNCQTEFIYNDLCPKCASAFKEAIECVFIRRLKPQKEET